MKEHGENEHTSLCSTNGARVRKRRLVQGQPAFRFSIRARNAHRRIQQPFGPAGHCSKRVCRTNTHMCSPTRYIRTTHMYAGANVLALALCVFAMCKPMAVPRKGNYATREAACAFFSVSRLPVELIQHKARTAGSEYPSIARCCCERHTHAHCCCVSLSQTEKSVYIFASSHVVRVAVC